MKRFCSLFLALSMMLGVCLFAACGETDVQQTSQTTESTAQTAQTTTGTAETTDLITEDCSTESSATETTSATVSEQTATTESTAAGTEPQDPSNIFAEFTGEGKLPGYENIDFRGAEFIIAGYENGESGDGYDNIIEIYSDGSDSVSVAVRLRNETIEKLYNCTITPYACADTGFIVGAEVTSGKQTIDLYGAKYGVGSLATSGSNYNLLAIGLDSTLPFWDSNYVNTYTIKNSSGAETLYSIVGDFSIYANDLAHALLFNKTVYDTSVAQNVDTDIYELVRTGKWTFDRFLEMTKLAAKNVSGNDDISYSEGDIVGWCTTSHATHGLHVASGLSLMKTENGVLTYALINDKEKWVDIIDKAREVWSDPSHDIVGAGTNGPGLQALVSNSTLFYSDIIRHFSYDPLLSADTVLGVIPYPKYSETQDTYYHYVDNHLTSYAIPVSVSSTEEMIQFFTLYAAYSTAIVRPAWLDAYAYDYCGDPNAKEMLPYIIDNRTFDPGYLIFSGLEGDISGQISGGSNNVTKIIDKRNDFYTKQDGEIDKYIAGIDDNQA